MGMLDGIAESARQLHELLVLAAAKLQEEQALLRALFQALPNCDMGCQRKAVLWADHEDGYRVDLCATCSAEITAAKRKSISAPEDLSYRAALEAVIARIESMRAEASPAEARQCVECKAILSYDLGPDEKVSTVDCLGVGHEVWLADGGCIVLAPGEAPIRVPPEGTPG